MMMLRRFSMNASENNNTINQEVYESIREVMLQERVVPKEVIGHK